MRSRRHRYVPNNIPVYDESALDDLDRQILAARGENCEGEIRSLRARENEVAFPNEIADFAIYQLPSIGGISNALKTQLYEAAIRRFRHRMPAEMIRMFVDATILKDQQDKQKAAQLRNAEAARKARDGKRPASVLSSPA